MHCNLKTASVIAVSSVICCAAVPPAFAQGKSAQETKAARLVGQAAEVQEEEDRGIIEAQGPADREGFSPSDPTFQLLATSDDKEVSLGLTLDHSTVQVNPQNPYKQRAQTLRFSAHGFAPVDKDGGDRFVNLAKPLSGSRLKFGLSYYFSSYTLRQEDIDVAVQVMNLSFDNCTGERISAWAADKPEVSRQLAANYREIIEALKRQGLETESAMAAVTSPDFDNLNTIPEVRAHRENAAFRAVAESKDLPAFAQLQAAVDRCRIGNGGDFQNNEQLIARYGNGAPIGSSIRGVTANAPTFFVGGHAAFGRKSFSFLDRTAFVIQDKTKGEYELSAFGGIIGGDGLWSLRTGVTHARTYEAQDEVQLCQPTGTPGQLQCLSGPDGAPDRTKVTALTLEARRLFTIPGTKSRIGVAPEFAFDPDDSEYTIEVPIYFVPDKDGKLTGGVQFSYGSKKDDLVFGLFVGVPFTVFQ